MKQTCRYCAEQFTPGYGKPGRINVCYDPDCQRKDRKDRPEPGMLMAKVSWENKHTPIIEVVRKRSDAIAFNKAQRRNRSGPLSSIITSQTSGNFGRED